MIKPHLTEKAVKDNQRGVYIFDVSPSLNKHEISKKIEEVFKVKVISIKTLIKAGKTKRFKGIIGKQNKTKKAIITLAPGQKIAGFESEEEKDTKKTKKAKSTEDKK